MTVRSVKPIKQNLPSFDSAYEYITSVRNGKGKYRKADLEIHYNARKQVRGRWQVVVVDEPLPKIGKPCVECPGFVLDLNDYLCTSCRESPDP
jgi:hypothetical protein